jgi:hypothetical protein
MFSDMLMQPLAPHMPAQHELCSSANCPGMHQKLPQSVVATNTVNTAAALQIPLESIRAVQHDNNCPPSKAITPCGGTTVASVTAQHHALQSKDRDRLHSRRLSILSLLRITPSNHLI